MIERNYLDYLIKGLFLFFSVFLILSIVNAYNLNYEIYPESNNLTLQSNSNYSLNVFYKLNTTTPLNFSFDVICPEGIEVNNITNIKSYLDFKIKLNFRVKDIKEGSYPIILRTKVLYNGKLNVRDTILNLNVEKNSGQIFFSSDFRNDLPELELINISQTNFIIDSNSSTFFQFNLKNLGSASSYILESEINSLDKNKINIIYSEKIFDLQNNESKTVLINVDFNNYNLEYTSIDFFAIENSTNKKYFLGRVNFVLNIPKIDVFYNKDLNLILITNNGLDKVNLDLNNNIYSENVNLIPGQILTINLDENIIDYNVSMNNKLISSFVFEKEDKFLDAKKNKDLNFSGVAGFFSLSEGSIYFGITILILIIFILIIRKLFFTNSIFGKSISVKNIKL